jgi:hypothetical protein
MWRECWLWEFSDIIHSWLSSLGRSSVPITVLVLPGQLQQGSISSEHSKFSKVNSWNEFGIVDNLFDEELIVWDRLWIVICESIQIVSATWLNAKSHSLVIYTLHQEFVTSDVMLHENFDQFSSAMFCGQFLLECVSFASEICVQLSIEKSKRSSSLSKSCNSEFNRFTAERFNLLVGCPCFNHFRLDEWNWMPNKRTTFRSSEIAQAENGTFQCFPF